MVLRRSGEGRVRDKEKQRNGAGPRKDEYGRGGEKQMGRQLLIKGYYPTPNLVTRAECLKKTRFVGNYGI